jgi:MerR family copper efflux transcriptional regulator
VRSPSPKNWPLRSGELARLVGVSTDTLRFYERQGLLQPIPRSASGYRLFAPEALLRVQLIRSALSIGFSVRELAVIFGERDRGLAPCRRVRRLAAEKLTAIEGRLKELQSLRRVLQKTLASWDRTLRKTSPSQRASLLEAFAAAQAISQSRRSGCRPTVLRNHPGEPII